MFLESVKLKAINSDREDETCKAYIVIVHAMMQTDKCLCEKLDMELPEDRIDLISDMAHEFVNWQFGFMEKPDWIEYGAHISGRKINKQPE